MLGKTLYSTDVRGNDRHILLFYKKFHFCHLLPFAEVGQIDNDIFNMVNRLVDFYIHSDVILEYTDCPPKKW